MSSRKRLSLRAAYQFGAEQGLEPEITEIRNMDIEWDLSYTSTLSRGYIVDLFQRRGPLREFIESSWPEGATRQGEAQIRHYLNVKTRYERFLAEDDGEPQGEEYDNDLSEQAFAAESDLRDFLAGNLDCIESGLRLYEGKEHSGIEFPLDPGRIDILAVDTHGKYVVIELKLSRGRNKTLGQLLYYMGWVDTNLGNGPCRGIIVAREIGDDLRIAAQRVPGISLYRYDLKVSVEKLA